MDLTPLGIGIALIVIGFALCIVGERMKRPTVRGEPTPPWDEILRKAADALLTAVGKIISGPTTGDRVQGLGSALAIVGAVVIIGWLILTLLPKTQQSTVVPTTSPSPSGS